MAIANNAFPASDLVAVIPEVWAPIINEKNFPKAVLSNFCLDLSAYTEGDSIHVPDLYTNALTVNTQSTEGAEITPTTPLQVDTTISVDTHSYVAFMFGDKTMRQVASKYNLNAAYARQAQGLLMNTLEAALAALWSSLTTAAVGDTSNAVSDADIRVAISTLAEADFDETELAFFFAPEVFWTQLHGISKYYTDDTANLMLHKDGNFGVGDKSRGLRGGLFGIPIYTTTNIVNALQTYRNLLLHPRAFGWGIQQYPGTLMTEFGPSPLRIRVQAEYQLPNLATLVVADMVYGVGVIRPEAGVVINASTAFITS